MYGIPITAHELPAYSAALKMRLPERHILIRTHSPQGEKPVPGTDKSILLTKNPKWPRIWAWVLAVRAIDSDRDGIKPGQMVVFRRYAEDQMAEDVPIRPAFLGHSLPIEIIHIDALECLFDPAFRPVEI